jgi:hypothetical protein
LLQLRGVVSRLADTVAEWLSGRAAAWWLGEPTLSDILLAT